MGDNDKPRVKGSIIRSTFDFLRKRKGGDKAEEVAKVYGKGPKQIDASKFYPYSEFGRLCDAMEAVPEIVSEEEDTYFELGRYFISKNTLMLQLLRLYKIESLVEKLLTIPNFEIEEHKVTSSGPKDIEVTLNTKHPDRRFCRIFAGMLRAALDIKSLKGEVKKTFCQIDGEEQCVFEMSWTRKKWVGRN